MDLKSSKSRLFLISAGLVLLVVTAFEPVRHNEFVDFDDMSYIPENPHVFSGLTWSSIKWAFTSGYAANWHPLTWLSHMLDIELFGLNPLGHHLHNLLLHTLSTVLLFWLLYRMTGTIWRSAFTAAVFGIHPLRVQSVAWASERKDVLSILFFMLTLFAYLAYVKQGRWLRYLAVLLLFALGLMAKPTLVTLPILLLLLDYWPLQRHQSVGANILSTLHPWRFRLQLMIEKIPLLGLTLISCIVTFLVQEHGGAVTTNPIYIRIINAIFGYAEYLNKIFWPKDLALLYPYPIGVYPLWPPTIAAIILALITAFVIYRSFQKPYWLVGWAWYIVTLLPVIGLIQVGSQTIADRYTYLPSIGIILPLSWMFAEFADKGAIRRWIVGIAGMICIVAMVISTRTQVRHWKDSVELYSHTLSVTRNNYIIHQYLGKVYLQQGQLQQATEQITLSLSIQPRYKEALQSMAFIHMTGRQYDKAMDCLKAILNNDPQNVSALYNMGIIMEIQNRPHEALQYYEQASQLDQEHFKSAGRAGLLYMRQGNFDKAIELFQQSLSANPAYPEAQRGLEECTKKQNSLP